MRRAFAGDYLFIGLLQTGKVLCILADERSTVASQLCWLFELKADECGFALNTKLQQGSEHVSFVARAVLGQIGIEMG